MNAQSVRLEGVRVERLYVSEGHNFFGHHGKEPSAHPTVGVGQIECVAGKGLRGDRFFEREAGHKGQVTFFSMEVYDALCAQLGVSDREPAVLRRNVFVRGVELNALVGQTFELQGVKFEGIEECRPCYWMDRAFAKGAEEFLKGQGGLRARVVESGILRLS